MLNQNISNVVMNSKEFLFKMSYSSSKTKHGLMKSINAVYYGLWNNN